MKRSHCSSCGAPLIWAQTINGRAIPLDPVETPERGNLRRIGRTPEAAMVVEVIPRSEIGQTPLGEPEERYVSHFATCPNASEHRKER